MKEQSRLPTAHGNASMPVPHKSLGLSRAKKNEYRLAAIGCKRTVTECKTHVQPERVQAHKKKKLGDEIGIY